MEIGLTLLASRIDSASDVFIDARLASILSGRHWLRSAETCSQAVGDWETVVDLRGCLLDAFTASGYTILSTPGAVCDAGLASRLSSWL